MAEPTPKPLSPAAAPRPMLRSMISHCSIHTRRDEDSGWQLVEHRYRRSVARRPAALPVALSLRTSGENASTAFPPFTALQSAADSRVVSAAWSPGTVRPRRLAAVRQQSHFPPASSSHPTSAPASSSPASADAQHASPAQSLGPHSQCKLTPG
jgi:hypothetical protein